MVERIGNEEGIEFGANIEAAEPILVAQANIGTTAQPAPAPTAVETRVVVELEDGNVLRLPATASVDQPRENGTDLEFVQPDGTVIVVPNGAIQGLTIFIGSAEIPPLTVAALFESNGIEAAAGPAGAGARSSGGNFEVPAGGIGDAFALGSLLDPTELAFGTPDFEDLYPANSRPSFGSDIFGLRMSEEGLTFGIPDANPLGSDTTDNPYFLVNLGASDPDGDPLTFTLGQPNATLFSNGQEVVWEGVGTDHIIGRAGGLTVIDITIGGPTGIVFIRLMQPVDHPAQGEDVLTFGLSVTANDGRGGTATTTLNIGIEDDSAVIGASTSVSVDEDGLSNGVNNTASPGDNDDANRISATGSLNIRWGADNGDAADGLNADGSFAQDTVGRAVYFSQADFDAFVLANGGLKSGENGLTFTLTGNGTVITAYTNGGEDAEGAPVFRISLSDDGAGQYKFQLLGQLDHPKTSDGESETNTGGYEDDIVLNLSFTAKDADGDLANGKFSVVIDDDMPVVKIVATEASVTHDETALPQNPLWSIFGPGSDKDDNDVGVVASILRVSQYFSGVQNTGNDADVSDVAKLFFHGAIGYAESSKSLIAVDVAFGADGAAVTNSLVYSLVLGNAESSGLKTTEGQLIYLFEENGVIVGRVGNSDGPAAIALYVDADTGKVTIAQWLSLQHENTTSHDEFTSLAQSAVLVKVTATDGDGDSSSASADISTQVRFEDDGPTLEWFSVRSKASISHDETPGVDNDAKDISTDMSGLFTGVAGGNDPHVAGNGAIGYAQVAGGSLFSIGVDFGSDGKHDSGGYKFALSIGEATTAIKTTEGNAIRLELDESGRIVGVVVGGAFNGKAAFALYIDPATGDVTLEQYLSLQHNNTGSHDESIWLASNNVRVTLTVTDGDGDTASKTVNIGSKVAFQDDGPNVIVSAVGNSTVTHDESAGPQNAIWNWFGPSGDNDDNDVGVIASIAKVSGLFNGVNNHGNDPDVSDLDKLFFNGAIGYAQSDKPLVSYTANFGADGAAATGSVKYSLELGGQPSGLKTTEGHDIVLKLVNGIIVGEVVSGPFQGQAAFAIHVDQQTGKVTMAQWLSLEHGSDPTQHDDAISLAQGSVSVKVTVEDRDGDTHAHSADVSNQIRFEDDGPALDKFRTETGARIVHDETPGLQGDDTNANVSGLFAGLGTAMGHAAVAGSSLFSISASFGSDGKPQGETGYTFKLSVGQPTTSLKTVDGEAITLSLEDGLIVGRIGSGAAAFAIHIDAATGNVTLAQYLPLKHTAGDHDDVRFLAANNVKVTLTITDGDGDTVTSKALSIGDKIGFRDDGPDAVVDGSVALPVLTVDESNGMGSGQDGKLATSASFAANFGTVIDYGADGAGSIGYALKLVGINVGSGLYAVDASATDGKGSEIVLNQSGGVITGSLGGVNYFTITVDGAGKVTFTLTGNAPVWHANTGNHDDASTLDLAANKLLLTQTVTDADGDKDNASIDIGSTGVFTVEDDGPVISVAPANGLSNGLFFTGFTSNSPEWGQGSGYTSGTAGAWTITSSASGGSGSTELQRVGDGYRGADSPTDSVMVDLEASPGNVAITQQITGLVSGETYRLSFEIGAANDPSTADTAKLEVFWNGVSVGIYTPASGVMQTQVLNLVAQAGNNSLTFQEIGVAGDNTGTFLANVQINDLIIIDESAGIQPDSDEVDGASVAALFAGLQAGVDPNMAPQYAQGTGAVVASSVNYGADGQGAALAYAFNITAGVTSLKTTEGQVISLALDGGRVVGTYLDGGISKVAFALHVNGSTGVVTVAQFVSLEHPVPGSSHDEGLYLPAGSVRVSVTATDGDGDKATASSDITGLIRFEDDGPRTGIATVDALGAELIKNGGFEDGHNLGSGSNWNLFNSIDHWTKSGSVPFEVQTGDAGGTGNTSAVIELDGDSDSQGGAAPSAEGTNASIEQLVQGLVAGQTYQLSFGYAPRTNGDAHTAGLEVWFGSKLVFPVGNSTYPANQWTTVTITVTATEENAVLKFAGTGAQDEFGALIDNVSLRASYGGLDDDSQPHGNPGGIDDDADGKILVGNLNIDAGADGLKSIVFDAAAKAPFKAIWLDNEGVGNQMDVKLVWEAAADGGGVLKGTMEVNGQPVPVLTLTVGKDGSFTLAMHAPLAHAEPGSVPNHEDNLLLNLGYTVTDGDFDTARGTLSVTVDDDTPVAVAGAVIGTVKEADIAQEAGEPVWRTFEFSGGVQNQPVVFPAGSGLVANGTTLSNGHFGTVFGLNGQPIVISAADNNSTFQFAGMKVGVAGPNKPMVVEVAGYDGQGNLVAKITVTVPGPTPNGVPLTTLVSSPNLLDGKEIVRLEIKSLEPGSIVQIDDLEIGYAGSAGPVVPAEVALDLSTLVNFGADGVHADGGYQIRDLGKTAFGTHMSEGDQVFVKAANGVLTGYTDDNAKLFTLEIADGKAVFKLYGEFDHTSQSNLLNLDFGRFITAVDGDGDGIVLNAGAVIITIEDANRVPTAGEVKASVDDDGLPGSNPATATDDIVVAHPVGATEATFAGVLQGSGGDGTLTFSFANMGGKPGTIGQETVKYNWDSASHTLTAEITSGARLGQNLFNVVLNPVTGAYTLTLLTPVMHTAGANTEASVFGELSYTVGDSDADTSAGDLATGTLSVEFNDDVPTANSDSQAQSAENTAVTVNVLANDTKGADGVNAADPTKVSVVADSLTGTGTLVYNNDGTFTYTPAAREAGTVKFNYTITDGDGDQSTATVTITLNTDSVPTIVVAQASDTSVDEAGLPTRSGEPAGSASSTDSETATGTFTITTGNDTIGGLFMTDKDGNEVNVTTGGPVQGQYGVLTVSVNGTAYSYSYTLDDNTSGDATKENFAVRVQDSDGSNANTTLTIDIVDDVPTAVADNQAQSAENTAVTVNVLANDTKGADSVNAADPTKVSVVADSLTGAGTLVYNNDGTFTYTPAAGEAGTVKFNYTITDGDGDPSTATVTITLNTDSVPTIVVAQASDTNVAEAGLPARIGESAGSDSAATSETATGTFTITTSNDTIGGLFVTDKDNAVINVTAGGTVHGQYGVLTVTVTNGAYSYSYTLSDNTAGDATKENFAVRVQDSDGSNANTTLTIDIVDDVPVAVAGPVMTVAETAGITDGVNLLVNDVQGADGATVTHVSFDGNTWIAINASGTTSITPVGGQGTYIFQANGAWTFDPSEDASQADQNGNFYYRITDGDGDVSEAQQLVAVTNVAKPSVIVGSNLSDTGSGSSATDDDHIVRGAEVDGKLDGTNADDVIIGDPGKVTINPGQSANIVLALDSSGSMDSDISFGGSTISRLQALKNGVNALIDSLSQSGGENVRVTVIDFDTNATNLGTFNLIVNGVVQTSQITAAKSAVNGMTDNGNTNYEAAMQAVYNWIAGNGGNNDLPNADVNKVVFVSDGEPQSVVNSSGSATTGVDATRAMQELLGTYEGGWDWDSFSNVPSDKVNDVTRVLNAVNSPNNYTIEAIGINVGPTALGYLSDVEDGISGAAGGGSATNATSAEQLANALSVLGGSTEMAAAGNDVVNGGGGNDIIFGDVINTDQLKVLYPSIPANLQQAGSGWAVIAWLEANVPAWGGRAGTIAYIAANHAALAAEGGRTGGNDTIDGGDGNDIIYGQEGNDTIDGGIGNDTITGGTGTDRMYGGAGSDTFRLANGEFASSELIDGGADNDTILLTNATTVDFTTGTITAVENLTGSTGDDKVTLTAALLDSFTTVNLGGGDDTLTISGNVNSSNDSQLQGVENIVLQSAATLNLSNQTEGFKINGSSGVDMITGGAGADTITGGAGADSLNGGAGEDIFQLANGDFAAGESINGGADNDTIVLTNATTVNFTTGTLTSIENLTGSAGSDTVTLSGTQLSSITTVDLGGGTDTLNVNGSVTSTADAQLQGIENVAMTGGAATLNLSAQTEAINITGSTAADVIYAAAGGGTITPGNGADTVVIQAGTTAANWTIELASDSAADTIVFKHGGAGSGHNTVVTVNGFVTSTSGNSNDRIAIEVGGSSVTSGSNFYMTKSNNSTNEAVGSSVKVIELAHNNFTTSSLTDDTNSASGPRQEIADAIGSIGAGTYTVIIYSGNGASANAGIYTLTVPNATTGMNGLTNAISGANSFTLEHVMTLNGVGFGNLSSSHFVATPSAIDPLLLDLDNNGYAFSTLGEGAAFDLDADGKKDQLAWNSSGDGILAYDVNGNGTIDNGSELFTPWFNGGNFANGSAALASLDSNGDGVIDANDEAFGKLQIWQDTNGDGVSDAGELKSLADHGITSLSASTTATNGSIDGQAIVGEGTFTRADGTTGGYVEVELDIASGGGEAPVQDETIIGTDDDDFLTGTDGDDIIIGGLGNDTLTGGAGADTFVFSEAGPDNVDTITDFVADEDAIDLGALLDAALIDENNIGDYVRIQDNGSDGMLQVDTTGTGANWVDVANLTGHGVSGTVIDIKLDDETHHIPTI